MTDLEALVKERQARLDALEDPEAYRQYIARGHHGDFIYPPAEHHRLIQEACRKMIMEDDCDVLLIMAPPGSAKSTYGSVQIPTWVWSMKPEWKILAASNTSTLAEDFARRRRSVCEMEEWQQVSDTELDPMQINIAGFANKRGGVMYARGAGSAIAGVRCNLFVWDDLISSFEEASSPGQLDKLWEWYQADARTRLVPTGKEIGIMTRWSRQDPMGRILERIKNGEEPKRVKVLRLPMLCDDPENDPMGRELNEPLWPDWFTDAQIADNINHPTRWPALYQQVPIDQSGAWVHEQYVKTIKREDLPHPLTPIMATDIALSDGKGDYTIIGNGGIDEDRNLYLIDLSREQVNISKTLHKMQARYGQYRPPCCLIDDDNASKVFIEAMKEFARNGGEPVPLRKLPLAGNDKEWRAAPLRDMFMQGKVYIVEDVWTHFVLQEIMNFPPKSRMEHDDIIDMLALMARDLWAATTPRRDMPDVEKPIETAYIQREDGIYTRKPLKDLWEKPKSKRNFRKLRL